MPEWSNGQDLRSCGLVPAKVRTLPPASVLKMENKDFNKELLKIWKEHKDILKVYPLFCPDFKEDCILFIGINPSFSDKAFKRMKKNGSELIKKDLIYPNTEKEEWIIKQIIKDEKDGKKIHPYFKKFIEIAEETKQDWEHLDLFFFRETSQNKTKTSIGYKKNNKDIEMNDFGSKQLKLSLSIIEKIHPKIIVVCNALASEILQDKYKINPNLDEEGFHKIEINNKKTPILFSGMLTGQRALDNDSLERLKWHIRRVLNYN